MAFGSRRVNLARPASGDKWPGSVHEPVKSSPTPGGGTMRPPAAALTYQSSLTLGSLGLAFEPHSRQVIPAICPHHVKVPDARPLWSLRLVANSQHLGHRIYLMPGHREAR
jgi:hypothetical protein